MFLVFSGLYKETEVLNVKENKLRCFMASLLRIRRHTVLIMDVLCLGMRYASLVILSAV
jgi:hypothetical protein